MTFYLLIEADEDGVNHRVYPSREVALREINRGHGERVEAGWGALHFKDEMWFSANQDPDQWPSGTCVLMRCEARVPRPETKTWTLPA